MKVKVYFGEKDSTLLHNVNRWYWTGLTTIESSGLVRFFNNDDEVIAEFVEPHGIEVLERSKGL